jgi:NitT/TauT family transport system substrate-binding protein
MKRSDLLRGLPATLAVMGNASAARAQGAPVSLHVAMSVVNYDAAPLYYAQRNGWFTSAGLNVSIDRISSGAATAAAVASQTIAIGKATTMAVLSGFGRNVPFRIIAPAAAYDATHPDGSLCVAVDSPIKSAADFNGKTLGTASILSEDHVGTMAWIDQHGGDSKSIHFVETALSVAPIAIASHRIDGAFITEPLLSQAIADGKVKPLMPVLSAYGKHFLYSVWFASQGYIDSNPEAVQHFIDTIMRSQVYVNGHHPQMAPLVADLSGLSVAEVAHAKLATCATALVAADLQPLIDTAAKYGAVPKAYDAKAVIYKEIKG